ncbi:MAG: RND transporter [Oceanospirillaceae bacterium]|nr:RND transporter [Oceanospirillaceae bacterium]|tara:strand:- start:26722 stop:29028 length:2307 start_codon:yes stop_codon:yes gene_type:complete
MKKLIEYWATERPWLVIALFVIASVTAIAGAKNLYFRGDYQVFFEDDYGPLADFEHMQKVFTKTENVAILMIPESGDVVTTDMLNLVREFTDMSWQTPYSSRVDSLTNFQYTWSEYDDMMVDNLVPDQDEFTSEELERIRSIALDEPSLRGNLISPDSKATMINIILQLPDDQTDKTAIVSKVKLYVDGMIEKLKQEHPGVSFYQTGVIPMNYAFAAEARKDMQTLIPIMLVVVVGMIGLMMRSALATVAVSVVLVLAIGATMGLAGWWNYFLSVATINVPIVVFIIGVADCVHIAATMQYAQKLGKGRKEAVVYSLDLNWVPIFITSATTAVGFLTLTMSDSPVFADFGLLCAVGVTICYLMSILFFPALLTVMPIRLADKTEKPSPEMHWLADKVIKYKTPLLIFLSIVTVLVGSLAFKNDLNDMPIEYFAESTEFRQAAQAQNDNLSGVMRVDFALYSHEEGGISEPEFIYALEQFQQWLNEQPEVEHASSLADIYKRLNKNMHADDESWYKIPEDRELAAQYLLLYEMSLPYGLDLNNQINIDKSAARVTAIMGDTGTQEILDFEISSKAWFEENFPGIEMKVASPAIMFSHIGLTNMHSMIKSLFIAILLISGIMMFALKSLRLGAISLIPTLSPALVGFGIWFLISGYLNLGLSIVASMTLGIIVDDCVHFLAKYKRARADGMSTEEAVRYAFVNVGRALVITTVVLSVGFSILLMSAFRLNSDMGLATTIVLITALVIDFLFLPPLLLVLDKDKKPKAAAQ